MCNVKKRRVYIAFAKNGEERPFLSITFEPGAPVLFRNDPELRI